MSSVSIQGNASGTGIFTIASPNSNTNRTLTLPEATTTVVGTDATQTLTNKTIQGGAITSGTAVASTSGTSIDFTGIPSWVKRITVMFSGVSTNGTSVPYLIQLGDSGGFETTGYLGASSRLTSTVSTINSTAGIPINLNNAATNTIHGIITIALLNSATNLWAASGVIAMSNAAESMPIASSKSLSDTLTQVRITTAGGTDTFDAGTINILYEG